MRAFFIRKYALESPEQNRLDAMVDALERAMTDTGVRDTHVFAPTFGGDPAIESQTSVYFRDADYTAESLRFSGDCTVYAVPASGFNPSEEAIPNFIGDLKDGVEPVKFVLDITTELDPEAWARAAVETIQGDRAPEAAPAL